MPARPAICVVGLRRRAVWRSTVDFAPRLIRRACVTARAIGTNKAMATNTLACSTIGVVTLRICAISRSAVENTQRLLFGACRAAATADACEATRTSHVAAHSSPHMPQFSGSLYSAAQEVPHMVSSGVHTVFPTGCPPQACPSTTNTATHASPPAYLAMVATVTNHLTARVREHRLHTIRSAVVWHCATRLADATPSEARSARSVASSVPSSTTRSAPSDRAQLVSSSDSARNSPPVPHGMNGCSDGRAS
jgi:hypothetical protein